MIRKPINQSIKLVNWYWSSDNQSITTQKQFIDYYWLAQQPWTDVTHAIIPTQSSQHKEYTLVHMNCTCTRITHLPFIAFPCHYVYARRHRHRLRVDGRQEQAQTFELSKKNGYLGTGHWTERREYYSPVNIQSIKMKCVYNYCIQRCDIYVPIPFICNQWIPIDISLSVDCYWKSIPIDKHTNLRHRLVIDYQNQSISINHLILIDIDCHRLSIFVIGYAWI